jgi:hypothetical protein
VTTPSNAWGEERWRLSHQLQMRGHMLGRRQARRMCRNFSCVGVDTTPERLRQMSAGAPIGIDEVTAINFALIATEFRREERGAKLKQMQRRGTRSLILAALILVVLNFLFCVAYVLLNLAQQTSTY